VTNWRTLAANTLSIKPIHNVQHSEKLASFGNFTYMGDNPLPALFTLSSVEGPALSAVEGFTLSSVEG
jgi:hypothetical protein